MTIKIPKITLADKVLKLLGKKRGVLVPSSKYQKFASSSYIIAQKENFFKAFFRSVNKSLPKGMVDLYTFIPSDDFSNKTSDKNL